MPRFAMMNEGWTSTSGVCGSQVRPSFPHNYFHTSSSSFPTTKSNYHFSSLSTGTYGGHLELTAFAHLKRRDVKVIQPGLVYVIEWTSGADLSPTLAQLEPHSDDEEQEAMPERDARKTRRERKKEMRAQAARAKQQQAAQAALDADDDDNENGSSSSLGAVYVAYVLSNFFCAELSPSTLIIALHLFGHAPSTRHAESGTIFNLHRRK